MKKKTIILMITGALVFRAIQTLSFHHKIKTLEYQLTQINNLYSELSIDAIHDTEISSYELNKIYYILFQRISTRFSNYTNNPNYKFINEPEGLYSILEDLSYSNSDVVSGIGSTTYAISSDFILTKDEAALLERFATFFKMMASEESYNKVKAYLLLDYELNPSLESELLKLDNIIDEYMTQSFIKRMNKEVKKNSD